MKFNNGMAWLDPMAITGVIAEPTPHGERWNVCVVGATPKALVVQGGIETMEEAQACCAETWEAVLAARPHIEAVHGELLVGESDPVNEAQCDGEPVTEQVSADEGDADADEAGSGEAGAELEDSAKPEAGAEPDGDLSQDDRDARDDAALALNQVF